VKCIYATENSTEQSKEEEKPIVLLDQATQLGETLSNSVPRGLERLFPGGKILPYHLPEWLRGAITLKHVSDRDDEVDLDINLEKLVLALSSEALGLIGADKTREDLEKARVYLEVLLTVQPDNATALYNLACTESLLGNIETAVELLDSAYRFGYTNVEHIEKDSDLNNVRGSEGYQYLVKKMRGEEVLEPQEFNLGEIVNIQPIVEEVQIPVQVVEEVKREEVTVEEVKVPEKVVEEVKQEVKVEEVKVPEKVVEEVKQEVKAPETRFPEELKTLESMGYDSSLCAWLLEEYRGDLTKALDHLFEHPGK